MNGVMTPIIEVKKNVTYKKRDDLNRGVIYIYNSISNDRFGARFVPKKWNVELRHFPHLCRAHFATEIQLELIMHGSPASEHVVHTFGSTRCFFAEGESMVL